MRTALPLALLATLAACGGGAESNTVNVAAMDRADPVPAVPAPAGTAWTDTVQRTDGGGWRMGNPDAAIKLVEYGSRTCHVCAEFEEQGFEPLQRYVATGKVSYEFRDYLRNGADMSAALLGGCGGTGPFFTILHQMYADQGRALDTLQNVPQATYEQIAALPPAQQATRFAEVAGYLDFIKQRGIPEAQARACLNDTAAIDRLVRMNEETNRSFPIPGTPTFTVNGRMLENTVAWPQVETALKAAGA